MLRKGLSLLFILCFIAAYVLNDLAAVYAQESETKKLVLAVLDFSNTANDPELDYLVRGIPESIITNLAKTGKLDIVERSRMQQALEELNLSVSGIIDEQTAVELGRAVGANAVMTGSFLKIGNIIEINTRLIDVKTLRVITSEQVRGAPGEEIFDLMDKTSQTMQAKLLGEEVSSLGYQRISKQEEAKKPSGGRSIFSRWWFWALLAGIGGGAAAATMAGGGGEVKPLPEPPAFPK